MKKRAAIIIVSVAFIVGGIAGFTISSYYWSRLMQYETVATSLSGVSAAYAPLKLLKNGKTDEATKILEIQLDGAMQSVELVSQTLNRPDMLTNSSVIGAKALR